MTDVTETSEAEALKNPKVAVVHSFKSGGKYHTTHFWEIPEGAIGPYDMTNSHPYRFVDVDSFYLVVEQEPWGYPHLLVPPALRRGPEITSGHVEKLGNSGGAPRFDDPPPDKPNLPWYLQPSWPPRPVKLVTTSILKDPRDFPVVGKHEGDIGADLKASIDEAVTLKPGEHAFLPAGFAVQFQPGWAALILPRSSSNRLGLHVHTGVIDNGYTGEIGTDVRNISNKDLSISPGDRVAQMVLIPANRPAFHVVDEFRETDRGDQGWGSTGA